MQYQATLRDRGETRCTKEQLNRWLKAGRVIRWKRLAIYSDKETR